MRLPEAGKLTGLPRWRGRAGEYHLLSRAVEFAATRRRSPTIAQLLRKESDESAVNIATALPDGP